MDFGCRPRWRVAPVESTGGQAAHRSVESIAGLWKGKRKGCAGTRDKAGTIMQAIVSHHELRPLSSQRSIRDYTMVCVSWSAYGVSMWLREHFVKFLLIRQSHYIRRPHSKHPSLRQPQTALSNSWRCGGQTDTCIHHCCNECHHRPQFVEDNVEPYLQFTSRTTQARPEQKNACGHLARET